MKSKTSCFNKTIFLKNITHFWPIWLMFTLWNLFIMPFMIYNHSLQYKYSVNMSETELAQMRIDDIAGIVNIYINPVVLFIFSTIAVMAVFSYLYNARSANSLHALPVTRKELFCTNYISGLLFLILPELVGFLLGILVSAICGYTSMNLLLTGLLFACGISFIFYSITVFIAMFTGQLLAVPIFTVIINFLYVGCKLLFQLTMSAISYGLPMNYTDGKLSFLSPLYYITGHLSLKYDRSGDVPTLIGLQGGTMIASYALAAVLFVVAAYLVYRIRDIETTGNLISIGWISPIFRWGAAFCGGTLLSILFCMLLDVSKSENIFLTILISGIVFGAVCFFAAQMFLEKGFRVFKKKRFMECGVFLAVFACMYLSIEFDLFGQERKIPDASAIESVSLDNNIIFRSNTSNDIAQVLEIHQQIIDSKKEFETYAAEHQDTYYISLKYRLKNGSALRREYEIPWNEDLMHDKNSVLFKVVDLSTSPEAYRKELFGIKKQDLMFTGCQIDLYNEQAERHDYIFSDEDAKKIGQAVLSDIEEGNFKNCLINRFFYEQRNKSTYYNSLLLDFSGKEDIVPVYAEFNSYYPDENGEKSGTTTIEFDGECKHIIEALMETGAIESETDLTTIEENNRAQENNEN